jgi:CheY-like chemotaxis protein/signal transduction histidine kinase
MLYFRLKIKKALIQCQKNTTHLNTIKMSKAKKQDENDLAFAPDLASLTELNRKLAAELNVARKELAFQKEEKGKRAAELGIANKERVFQDEEKGKRAAELGIANIELAFQDEEKEKRAVELSIANVELVFQNNEKEKRAAELIIANKELIFQNQEKENRAAELIIANEELVFQNDEKEKRAAELIIANKELIFQNDEKEKRAAELIIANKELIFQNNEKERRAADLIIANQELLFQNVEKEKRAAELEEKNKEVEAAKFDIEKKTRQLEVSSKYKSEFLANMSHELRTPLNSLLILSKDLSENKTKNLTDDQIECTEIIYKSGYDLLILINEVLDLSKIEAGKMDVNIETVLIKPFMEDLMRGFKYNAEQKGLKLETRLDIELPEFILSDSQRLKQILKNLVSNAIKFTDKGGVTVSLNRHSQNAIMISVADTGIGIQDSKQMAVFEAFQQADGTTSRKYGGTGLGLSISRELAKLLGAEINLVSKINEGSTFSVIVPLQVRSSTSQLMESTPLKLKTEYAGKPPVTDLTFVNYPTIRDDRDAIGPADKVVLLIEDDLKFADILLKIANKKGFKCISARTGEDGYLLAEKYQPAAIILDMGLPGINGDELLQKLKSDPKLWHIPVHIISGNEDSSKYLQEGAVEFLMKPVNKEDMEGAFDRIETFLSHKIKSILIIEDDENSRKALKLLIGKDQVKYAEAETAVNALNILENEEVDCIILDLDLPDMSGFEFINKLEILKGTTAPRIIIYTGMDLTKAQNEALKKHSASIIQKGAQSGLTLLRDTALFLHSTSASLNLRQGPTAHEDEKTFFHGKKILLVDDDYRNVFALTKILRDKGMEILKAENGIKALEQLDLHPGIELVLMDIMMPEMDGYEAMRRIRAQDKFCKLPVIAVTAKAMNYDQQKCLDAGANQYITKPVEIKNLLVMMATLLGKEIKQ